MTAILKNKFITAAVLVGAGGAGLAGGMLFFAKYRINNKTCYTQSLQLVQDHPSGRKYIGNKIKGGGVDWDNRVLINAEYNQLHFRVMGDNGRGVVFAKAQHSDPGNGEWNVESVALEVIETTNGEPCIVPIFPSKDSVASKLTSSVKKGSSTVADVLTASPSKLRGEAAEHLTTHLVQSKSTTDGKLELRTGGTPALYVRTTQGGSDAVSVRQMQRRSAEIRQAKEVVCGGTAGVGKQDAYELRSMGQIDLEKLLKSAGVAPCAPSSHSALALKADLHMPWNQMRKLRRWLKSFGCEIETENTMLASEMCPFTLSSGDVVSSPMGMACNLTERLSFSSWTSTRRLACLPTMVLSRRMRFG
eukprot:scpid36297/ scgid1257/ 